MFEYIKKRVTRKIRRTRRNRHSARLFWRNAHEFFYQAFRVLEFNEIDGDYAEFGSHGGHTFSVAYKEISRWDVQRHMWAFDSFQGLPVTSNRKDYHPKWQQGSMSTNVDEFHKICRFRGIPRDAYTVVDGFYADTLKTPDIMLPENIALAYVDCDLYSSTMDVLEFLLPRLKHGMILAFDDYFCWSSDQISGERKAMLEVFSENKEWNLVHYRDIYWGGTSFVVESSNLSRQ